MPKPSRTALHAALSASYGVPPTDRAAPMGLRDLLAVLDAALRGPGDRRGRRPIPPVVVGFALWNLAANHQRWAAAPRADRAALWTLDALIEDVFGWRLTDLRDMRRRDLSPPQLFARQYGFLDYRLDPPDPNGRTLTAKVTTLVQRSLETLRGAADPAQWPTRCALFWSGLERVGSGRFRGRLKVLGAAPTVELRATRRRTPFGVVTEFAVTDPRAPLRAAVCTGSISVEKEQGQPWATRIKQEKRLRVSDPADVDAAVVEAAAAALNYWIQSETVSLASPPVGV